MGNWMPRRLGMSLQQSWGQEETAVSTHLFQKTPGSGRESRKPWSVGGSVRPWKWEDSSKGRFYPPCLTLTQEASQPCVSAPQQGSTCGGWLAKMTVNHHPCLSPGPCPTWPCDLLWLIECSRSMTACPLGANFHSCWLRLLQRTLPWLGDMGCSSQTGPVVPAEDRHGRSRPKINKAT